MINDAELCLYIYICMNHGKQTVVTNHRGRRVSLDCRRDGYLKAAFAGGFEKKQENITQPSNDLR